jgi:hypothetical protein
MNWLVSLLATLCLTLAGWFAGSITPLPPVTAAPAPALLQAKPAAELAADGDVMERAQDVWKKTKSNSEAVFTLFAEAKKMTSAEIGQAISTAAHAGKNTSFAAQLAGYWAEVDLPAAREWLRRLGEKEQALYGPHIGRTWAASDPIGLMDWLDTLPEDNRRKLGGLLTDILGEVAGKRAPERVKEILIGLPSPDEKARDFGKLFLAWGASDPVRAGREALSIRTSTSRAAAIEGVARSWAAKDPAAALAWMQGINDAVLLAGAQASYATGLVKKDPKAAAEFLAELPDTERNQQALAEVLSQWVGKDAAAALKYADAWQGDSRASVYGQMFAALALSDPDAAAREFVARKDDLSVWGGGLTTISWRLAENGIDSLQAFAQQLNPEQATAVYRYGIGKWVEQDAAAAESWALRQPDGVARIQALYHVGLRKAKQDPGDAAVWAAQLPRTQSSDPAILSVGAAIFNAHPEKAVALSRQVTQPEWGQRALTDWAETWMATDPAAAGEWLRTSNALPAEIRDQLMRPSGRGRGAR